MQKSSGAFVVALFLSLGWPALAQDDAAPSGGGLTEEVKVKLVLVDTLVLTKAGETVPDLVKEDFELRVGGYKTSIDTFDVFCPIGAVPDLKEIASVKQMKKNPRWMPTDDIPRRVVFLFDYYTIKTPDRQQLLNAARFMLQEWKPENEEVMLAVLADKLRIEQGFTDDLATIDRAIRRLEYDKTLWPRDFDTGSGKIWFRDLAQLMDVLAAYDGPKAVVFFSNGLGSGATNDLWYEDVVVAAIAGRSVFYPTSGFSTLTASGIALGALNRLASDTGGRMPPNTSYDPSISYARAQRDLSCRYALGFYVNPEATVKARARPKRIRVLVNRENTQVRFPRAYKPWNDEDVRESRMRAAYHDPKKFESPLVRASAFPIRVTSAGTWDTLLAAHFNLPMSGKPRTIEVGAILHRGSTRIDKYKNTIKISPPSEGDSRSVTLVGHNKLKPGQYTMTLVASEPGGKNVVSSAVDFTVPMIPEGLMILQSPILARVARDGVLIRADKKDKKRPHADALRDIIGEGGSFEPLMVHAVERTDTLMMLWEACMVGKGAPQGPFVADRRVITEGGETVHNLGRVDINVGESKTLCSGKLDSFEVDVLQPGEYVIEVVVSHKDTGDLITRATTPLLVE